jgi:hypothetical protein
MENPSDKNPSSTPSVDERDLILSMRKLDLIKELGFVIFNVLSMYLLFFSFTEKNKLSYNVFNLISIKIVT